MSYTSNIDCSAYQCNNCLSCPTGCSACADTVGCDQWSTCTGGGGGMVRNPASKGGFGFTNTVDGRIRGGIKTPQAFRGADGVGREFNIFEQKLRDNKNMSNRGYNVNPNRGNSSPTVRMHPLGRTRRIGATVYDPISRMWKVDDGRPRDAVLSAGKIVWPCWGSCKTGSRWRGNRVKCKCNRATNGNCQCDGCAGDTGC
jgi:hypothetical protein